MFETNFSSIEHRYMKVCDGFNRKRRENKYTFPIFDKEFLDS